VVNGHSFIPIRQMAALVRRALAEVCTVPMLLVLICVYLADCVTVGRITQEVMGGFLMKFGE